jgi:hypothetical protein
MKKNPVINDIETRFRTLMIGSIARFEESFGYLWNHGSEPKNNNEQLFKDKWLELRNDLLNHGNHQMRLAIDDLLDYIEDQNNSKYQYSYKFYPRNNYKK